MVVQNSDTNFYLATQLWDCLLCLGCSQCLRRTHCVEMDGPSFLGKSDTHEMDIKCQCIILISLLCFNPPAALPT